MRNPVNLRLKAIIRDLVFKSVPNFILPARIKALKDWYYANEKIDLRLHYSLTEESVVFDLGGYEGQWAQDIWDRFRCTIHVFEPVSIYAQQIQRRFSGNSKIHVYEFGLAGKDSLETIYVDEESSSAFGKKGTRQEMKLTDVSEFVAAQQLTKIDLLKINIEGGEYELLEKIIDSKLISNVQNIQVQFHDFIDGAITKRAAIQQNLKKTHTMTYCYPFVWENWQLIN